MGSNFPVMSTLDYQGGEILAALESQFTPKLVAKPKPVIKISNAIVCSFFTSYDYYKSHGARLKANLEEIGVAKSKILADNPNVTFEVYPCEHILFEQQPD